jgi:hypothetical protein
LLNVTIDDQAAADSLPPVQGTYVVIKTGITFTPRFPFDPGRAYRVTFDPARLPKARAAAVVTAIVRLPPRTAVPATVVTAVYPSADVLPENLLRMYIEFSAPMGNGSGREFVHVLDERGRDVAIPFLPIDADFWNPDHTRFTLFFDPGRVKQGILPNQQIGRPLRAGGKYTLVVATDWRDADGAPLEAEFRRPFKVGPPETHAIALSSWRIAAPPAGTRTPAVVTFPKPLDHGLLARAVTVQTADQRRPIDGVVTLEANDTRWLFTPAAPWTAGAYDVVASSVLEDPAGNRIGHPFEAVGNASGEQAPDEFRVKFAVAGLEKGVGNENRVSFSPRRFRITW